MIEPLASNNLSMEEKRELVHAISKWSDGPDVLQSWSRRELLQILYEEMGKERKYTGMTKNKIIEHLLKAVSEKKSVKRKDVADPESQHIPMNNSSTIKRPRKSDNPSRLPIELLSNSKEDIDSSKYCQNIACRASLHLDDTFCKRCSCCICFQFDDNKDPSLWLVCNSEPPFEGVSCGMTCHLECALKHERSGILNGEHHRGRDGSFICVSCGKVNDLLRCWRKQLMTAKDTRRVDVLCYRVSLGQKLLLGSSKYSKLNEIVETAAKKLEADVGPIVGSAGKSARGIVNRLSSGPEVQKLCALAVETLDLMLSSNIPNHQLNSKTRGCSSVPTDLVRFENINATSVTVLFGSSAVSREESGGYTLWHRKANTLNYPPDATCTLYLPNARFLLSDLSPATEYVVKAVPLDNARQLGLCEVKFTTNDAAESVPNTLGMERDQSTTTNSSSLSNPSSGDESINITAHKEHVGDFSVKGLQDMPRDSVPLLDEERATWEDGSVHNTRNISLPASGELLTNIPKSNGLSTGVPYTKEPSTSNDSSGSGKKDMEIIPSERGPIINPSKIGISTDRPIRSVRPNPIEEALCNGFGNTEKETEAGSSTKKKSKAPDGEYTIDGSLETEYVYCVKMIRQLECEGYLEKNFRLKFLTWYSLHASPEEKRVVKVFIDTFSDDPICLAGQLVDTFAKDIHRRPSLEVNGFGFCTRLYH